KILIPIDGNESSLEELEHGLRLGSADRTRYTLVRVVTPGAAANGQRTDLSPPDAASGGARGLDGLAAALRARGYQVDTRLEPSNRPGEAIVGVADAIDADLIALTAGRRGFVNRLVFGSVSAHVIEYATTPVLVYCPREAGLPEVLSGASG